jgi:glycosyltransferase involved in cell wall biosynthesis
VSGVTLITCTGGRSLAFRFCEKWIRRQTYRGEVQWIVVDDCEPETMLDMGQEQIRPTPFWRPGKVTLSRNLAAALPHVRHEKILFIEDDDWYGPEYVAHMVEALDQAPLAGQTPSRYYNVAARKWRLYEGGRHASLCQTGIRTNLLPDLHAALRTGAIDMHLWARAGTLGLLWQAMDVVGIKGMPGRKGIGVGHRPSEKWHDDLDLQQLTAWIGAQDAGLYAPFHHRRLAV